MKLFFPTQGGLQEKYTNLHSLFTDGFWRVVG